MTFTTPPSVTFLSRRSVALPSFVIEALAAHVEKYPPLSNGLIFHVRGDAIYRRDFYRQAWWPARKSVGLDEFPFRNVRHTGASLAIAAGADPKTVMTRMGHASIKLTMDTYGQMFEGTDVDLAKKLDAMARAPKKSSKRLRPNATGQR